MTRIDGGARLSGFDGTVSLGMLLRSSPSAPLRYELLKDPVFMFHPVDTSAPLSTSPALPARPVKRARDAQNETDRHGIGDGSHRTSLMRSSSDRVHRYSVPAPKLPAAPRARACDSSLLAAASNGDVTLAKKALREGADLNTRRDERGTPLVIAAGKGHTDMVKLLLGLRYATNLDGVYDALTAAVQANRVDVVRALLPCCDVNMLDGCQMTPLDYAVDSNRPEIVRLLLCAKPHELSGPLFRAIKQGQSPMVNDLLRARPSLVWLTNANGDTPLISAILTGNTEMLKMILSFGASVNHPRAGTADQTPLRIAVAHRNVEAVRILVSSGANTNQLDNKQNRACDYIWDSDGREMMDALRLTPALPLVTQIGSSADSAATERLMKAVRQRNLKEAEDALAAGADVNYSGTDNPPLSIAARTAHAEMVRLLLKHGARTTLGISERPAVLEEAISSTHYVVGPMSADRAVQLDNVIATIEALLPNSDVNVSARANDSPLRLAAEKGFTKVVQTLLCAKPYDLETPFLCAMENGHDEIARELLTVRPDLNELYLSVTSLNAAIGCNDKTEVEYLLSNRPNLVWQVDVNGYTPLIEAIRMNNKGMVETVLSFGADVNQSEAKFRHRSPLMVALTRNNDDIVRILLKKGANRNYVDNEGKSVQVYAQKFNYRDLNSILVDPESIREDA